MHPGTPEKGNKGFLIWQEYNKNKEKETMTTQTGSNVHYSLPNPTEGQI
jgi:hypothetical protein